jgi:hypothetical protein
VSVPSLDNQIRNNRRIDWPGIVRTLLVQILVLVALAGVIVAYLNWSSDTVWAEFRAASKSTVSDPKHQPQSSIPVQRVKGQTPCSRRV